MLKKCHGRCAASAVALPGWALPVATAIEPHPDIELRRLAGAAPLDVGKALHVTDERVDPALLLELWNLRTTRINHKENGGQVGSGLGLDCDTFACADSILTATCHQATLAPVCV